MYILTTAEAAHVLRCDETDPAMLDLLPQVDAYIRGATGRDWTTDTTIHPTAKSAARMLLVLWHEDPGRIGNGGSLNFGLQSALMQLKAEAMKYINFSGRDGDGPIYLPGAHIGDTVEAVTGIVGATGDQSAAFETVITVNGQIQQVSTADLSECWYRAHLKPLEDL